MRERVCTALHCIDAREQVVILSVGEPHYSVGTRTDPCSVEDSLA
jgi:hypothetical protein